MFHDKWVINEEHFYRWKEEESEMKVKVREREKKKRKWVGHINSWMSLFWGFYREIFASIINELRDEQKAKCGFMLRKNRIMPKAWAHTQTSWYVARAWNSFFIGVLLCQPSHITTYVICTIYISMISMNSCTLLHIQTSRMCTDNNNN